MVNLGEYTSHRDPKRVVEFNPLFDIHIGSLFWSFRVSIASMGPRYFLFQAYSPRDEPMGPCIKDCSPDFAAKHQIYLCDKEAYVDMAKAAGFQLVSSELVHSLGRFPGKEKVYQREFIFLVLKKPAKSWVFFTKRLLRVEKSTSTFWEVDV